jgi:hypothetical protein
LRSIRTLRGGVEFTAHQARAARLDGYGDGVALSDGECASLAWPARFEAHTVENIAAVITRARQNR